MSENLISELLFARDREGSFLLVAGLVLGGPGACRGLGGSSRAWLLVAGRSWGLSRAWRLFASLVCGGLSRAAPGACRGPGGLSRAWCEALLGLVAAMAAYRGHGVSQALLGLVGLSQASASGPSARDSPHQKISYE